jgi:hypothetical protein
VGESMAPCGLWPKGYAWYFRQEVENGSRPGLAQAQDIKLQSSLTDKCLPVLSSEAICATDFLELVVRRVVSLVERLGCLLVQAGEVGYTNSEVSGDYRYHWWA